MRSFWIPALALVATLSSPLTGLAQIPSASPTASAPEGGGHHHGGGVTRMLAQLNLSADQKTRIDRIIQDQSLERKARMDAIMAVLTAEQQAQLKTLMSQHRHGGPAPNQ